MTISSESECTMSRAAQRPLKRPTRAKSLERRWTSGGRVGFSRLRLRESAASAHPVGSFSSPLPRSHPRPPQGGVPPLHPLPVRSARWLRFLTPHRSHLHRPPPPRVSPLYHPARHPPQWLRFPHCRLAP